MKLALLRFQVRFSYKVANFVGLVSGFVVGQGSIFIVNSYLIFNQDYESAFTFSLYFSIATLLITLCECGSIQILARHGVDSLSQDEKNIHFDEYFIYICIWRLFYTMLILSLSLMAFSIYHDGKIANFIAAFSPALIFWSVNSAGLIDSRGASGVSGILNSIPYIAATLGLILCILYFGGLNEIVLGISMAGGYFLVVGLQTVYLLVSGSRISINTINFSIFRSAGLSTISMMAAIAPGQLYQRLLLLIVGGMLPVEYGAAYAYAKNLVSAASQFVGFARRVSFPNTVRLVGPGAKSHRPSLNELFQAQTLPFYLSIALTLFVAVYGLAAISAISAQIGLIIILFSLSIFSESVSSSVTEIVIGRGLFSRVAIVRIAAVIFGSGAAVLLIPTVGITGAFVSDITVHTTVAILNFYIVQRWRAQL
ncbi:hypothetical protein [Oceanicaulis sp.]|uniref:hypothetical protein n=1 Tax=Oceanicaulis sp. TaxID=1924941 RepID=UPI003BAACDC7